MAIDRVPENYDQFDAAFNTAITPSKKLEVARANNKKLKQQWNITDRKATAEAWYNRRQTQKIDNNFAGKFAGYNNKDIALDITKNQERAANSTFRKNKAAWKQGKTSIKGIKKEYKQLRKSSKGIYSEAGAKIAAMENTPMGVYVKNKTSRVNQMQRLKQKPMAGLKYVAPGPENAFTGVRISKGGIGLAVAGIASMALFSGLSGAMAPIQTQNTMPAVNMGNLSGMTYDGSGNVQNGSRTLGATGDLVFGLSKMRRA